MLGLRLDAADYKSVLRMRLPGQRRILSGMPESCSTIACTPALTRIVYPGLAFLAVLRSAGIGWVGAVALRAAIGGAPATPIAQTLIIIAAADGAGVGAGMRCLLE